MNRRLTYRGLAGIALMLTLVAMLSGQSPFSRMNYQGHLTDAVGVPVPAGTYTINFKIYDAESGGELLWQETSQVTVGTDGLFSTYLGEQNGLDPSVFHLLQDGFTTRGRWLQLLVNGDSILPRTFLASVPASQIAGRLAGDLYTYGDEITNRYMCSMSSDTSGDTLSWAIYEVGEGNSSKSTGSHESVQQMAIVERQSADTLASFTARVSADLAGIYLDNDGYGVRIESGTGNTGLSMVAPAADTSFWLRHVSSPQDQQLYAEGRIGIGTKSPGAKLAAEANTIIPAVGGRNLGAGAGVSAVNSGSGPAFVGTASTGNLIVLYSAGSGAPRLVVDNDGNLCVAGTLTQSGGCDLAENMTVFGEPSEYEAGDVLVLSRDTPGKLEKTEEAYCKRVIGVYSASPGYHINANAFGHNDNQVPIALSGIVPIKVSAENGPIEVGDLLVTSSRLGYAMKATDQQRAYGSVIGKAMEPLAAHEGAIRVMVSLQ